MTNSIYQLQYNIYNPVVLQNLVYMKEGSQRGTVIAVCELGKKSTCVYKTKDLEN